MRYHHHFFAVLACLASIAAPSFAVILAPTDLPGVRLWLDGNDVDGDGVAEGAGETYTTTWVDKSGLSNNFTAPGVAPTRSLGAQGGKDVFSFNGSTQYFAGPAVLTGGDDTYTYFAVFNSNTASGFRSVYEQAGPGGSARSAILQENGTNLYGFNGESNDRHNLVPLNVGSTHVMAMMVDNALNPNNIRVVDNGVSYAGTTSNPAALNVGTAGATVGRKQQVNGEYWSGTIAEIIVYDRVLTGMEQSDVSAYLAGKWAVAAAPSGFDALKHRWSFNDGTANDSIGTAHGTLFNGASIAGGQLVLDGINDYVRTSPINSTITNKTLVAWLTLDNLTQRSGGVLTLENPAGADVFDSIVYGERTANQWMAGSNGFARSDGVNNGGALEGSLSEVMIAISYRPGGGIDIYRNGVLYATYNTGGPISYGGGVADVLMGLRHEDISGGVGTAGGTDQFLAGLINEARIYGDALSADQIAQLFALGPDRLQAQVIPEPATAGLLTLAGLAMLRRRRAA
jgi:hypothetical protein